MEMDEGMKGLKCARCDKRSKAITLPLLSHRTEDGFEIVWPTCGHDKYLECQEHAKQYLGCPVCGCKGEYT